jgi:hypothetical protein
MASFVPLFLFSFSPARLQPYLSFSLSPQSAFSSHTAHLPYLPPFSFCPPGPARPSRSLRPTSPLPAHLILSSLFLSPTAGTPCQGHPQPPAATFPWPWPVRTASPRHPPHARAASPPIQERGIQCVGAYSPRCLAPSPGTAPPPSFTASGH